MGTLNRRATLLVTALTALTACLPASAQARTKFRPRIGGAMGIVPPHGRFDLTVGSNQPVVFHGGTVMSGTVTVHTVFWGASGFPFSGSPGGGVPGYEALMQQFFTDAAHDSGTVSNVFSLLTQYPDAPGSGQYSIAYNAAADTINDTDPYPTPGKQCPSPAGTQTCVTDLTVTNELAHVIKTHDPTGTGLHDLWVVFLPPNVDECTQLGTCGTNAFAGYHSLSNIAGEPVIYAIIIDPLIEGGAGPGGDPQGNPDAEASLDTAAHETVEAITDPQGTGWMDPNGFEVGDECETPQLGTPLGYAPDGSPYNQLINGHQYLIQTMWSNKPKGCELSSSVATSALPLPIVRLRQFSSSISGQIGVARGGVAVDVAVLRSADVVATAITHTRANGSWGPVALHTSSRIKGSRHGFGDDRDLILVHYGKHGPPDDGIAIGAGGDPFSESGWTTWFDLDNGFQIGTRSLTIDPCGQTGVLSVSVNGHATAPPINVCQTETDAATVKTPFLTGASRVTLTSEDNRAVSPFAENGAEVALTVPLGEPGSQGLFTNLPVTILSSGVPSCTADLRLAAVTCSGLVPLERYALTRRRGHAVRHAIADFSGGMRIANLPGSLPIARGDVLTLTNPQRRTLTTLHVAHLRVDIKGTANQIASGSCEPGDYWGAPLTSEPTSPAVGVPGEAGFGTLCPDDGKAAGLPVSTIEQVDDLSGGATKTSVPLLVGTAPLNDAIVYGPFTALAQTGVATGSGAVSPTGAKVSLTLRLQGSKRVAFRAVNVATPRGRTVHRLRPGVYLATWVVRDLNGDTRTVLTRFVEQR